MAGHGSVDHPDAPLAAAGATHTPGKRCKKSILQSKTTWIQHVTLPDWRV
jgi:hypothetical protein